MAECPQCGASDKGGCVGPPGHACFLDLAASLLTRHDALLERVTVLERAIEKFIKDVDADLCCDVCEPGGPGEHRDSCPVPTLQATFDA